MAGLNGSSVLENVPSAYLPGHQVVECSGMLDTLFAFFSAFNPIVFALALSGGAIFLLRPRSAASGLRVPAGRPRDVKAHGQRSS
jgi:hypothetical protein